MMGAAARLLLSLTIAGAVTLAAAPLSAREYRSREVTREFQREHPCPSTGLASGACPGFRKDHVVPLACGGPDAVSNLQGQGPMGAKSLLSLAASFGIRLGGRLSTHKRPSPPRRRIVE